MAPQITADDLATMLDLLDSNGDGEVSKEEFKSFFIRINRMNDEAFDKEWKKIDRNQECNAGSPSRGTSGAVVLSERVRVCRALLLAPADPHTCPADTLECAQRKFAALGAVRVLRGGHHSR